MVFQGRHSSRTVTGTAPRGGPHSRPGHHARRREGERLDLAAVPYPHAVAGLDELAETDEDQVAYKVETVE